MIKKLQMSLLLFVSIITVFCLVIFIKLYPELLWFESFHYAFIWKLVIQYKLVVFSGFFLLSFLFLFANLKTAKHLSEQSYSLSDTIRSPFRFLDEIISQLNLINSSSASAWSGTLLNTLVFIISLVIAIFLGLFAKTNWHIILSFLNQVPFEFSDPIFQKNIGFYIFTLPLLKFVYTFGLLLLLITIGSVGWLYMTKKLFSLIFSKGPFKNHIKTHIFVLLGILFFWLSFGTLLKIYSLLYSNLGVVFGASFTDVYARWIGYRIILFFYIIQGILMLIWTFRKDVRIPLFFFGFIIVSQIFLVQMLPSLVQNYVVAPNELVKEKPFIEHNIRFTQFGYNLNTIQEEKFPVNNNLTQSSIQSNANTINNIRLWNQGPLKQTFSQLQEIRLYYEFENIDVDRYRINGEQQQVMLSAREMESSQLTTQAQTWINKHLVYTHGYGLVMTPVNQISKEGLPILYIKDLPPQSTIGIDISQPEIYFGEKTSDYVIVNTKQSEFDYPKGDKNVYTNYRGSGGIELNSIAKRLLYALKFSDTSIFISSQITSESRILYDRDIRSIVKKIAPFLIYDQDPYLVVSEQGRLFWMLDAYTISRNLPYSEPYKSFINYIRNSVKVTIDAYSGHVTFYIADLQDPIIQTYSKIYPDFLKNLQEMPQDLISHIRYPRDLFSVQASLYSTYHMNNPQVFYNREDLWALPKETYEENEQSMDAYYIVTKLPGEKDSSFMLMMPFTPSNKNNMIAWLGVNSDPENYGQMKVFKFPKEKTIYGPMQIESRIDQNTEISQHLTLWGQMGSRVIRGNIMVIPIEESIVYVEPIYLQATQSKLPELKRVIFAYDNEIVMKDTLQEALSAVFMGNNEPEEEAPEEKTSVSDDQLIQKLQSEFKQLKKSFGKKLSTIDQLLSRILNTAE